MTEGQAVAERRLTELAPTERWPHLPAHVAESRSAILKLEAALNAGAAGEPIKDFDPFLKHHFSDGIYAREMTIPQGMVVVGKIHRHAHLNIISQGVCAVSTPTETQILAGPLTFLSKPGTKRAVMALETTIWTTIHLNPSNTRIIDEIEQDVIAPTFEHYDAIASDPPAPALEQEQKLLLEKNEK